MNEKTQLSKKHRDSVEHKLKERERKIMPLSSQKKIWPIRLAHQHCQIEHNTESTNQNADIIQGIFVLILIYAHCLLLGNENLLSKNEEIIKTVYISEMLSLMSVPIKETKTITSVMPVKIKLFKWWLYSGFFFTAMLWQPLLNCC